MADHDAEELPPWDTGLQNERTGLAWQRTMLSGLACGLLVARLLAGVSLTLAVVTGVLALGATAGLGFMALRRFRTNVQALASAGQLGDGRSHALVVAVLGLTAVGAAAYVILV